MASSGAVRPAVRRTLQHCHDLSSSTRTSTMATPWRAQPRLAVPSLQRVDFVSVQLRLLSTSSPMAVRKTRDNNRLRGQSTIHRSGTREPLSVSDDEIPEPNLTETAGKMLEAENDPNHGLWGFFYDKKFLPTPADESGHGRAWTVQELRGKSWEDLHGLWWHCCRERNRIATSIYAQQKFDVGFGDMESRNRDDTVKKTLRAIRHVLTERFYAWEDARKLALQDPEINLSGEGPLYMPSLHFESAEDVLVDEPISEQQEALEPEKSPQPTR